MKISNVEENSLAQKIGLVIGDKILQVNGKKLRDIIDFSFEFAEEKIEILIEHADGSRESKSFDKDVDEELGVEFESAVFDGIKICKNHCVFCFVDMIAPNMRKTLSVKDDDYRLSFLYGNFITLTNLNDDDFKRIKNFHLSPLYISIHAMNPAVREKIMRTPLAAKIQTQLNKLDSAGVEYHTQIVLCPNLNDGDELNFTIEEILKRPNALSLAIVPVGVTKYRRDKFPLTQFDKAGALKVIQQVEKYQRQLRGKCGQTFIYLADEFYFLAELEMPPVEFYDDFPQIENGIGMTRNFIEEFHAENLQTTSYKLQAIDIICGTSIAKVFKKLVDEEIKKNPNLDARILPVENKFFGGGVNVSGLLTGGDIIDTLKKFDRPRDKILIPSTAIRFGENVFLDDVSLDDLQKIFPAHIIPISNGAEFRKVLSGN